TGHGDRGQPVTAPLDAWLEHHAGACHLAQRNGAARRGLHIDIVERRELIAYSRWLAQHHLDRLIVIAELADLYAGQHRLQGATNALRADAEGSRAVLVDVKLLTWHRLQPIIVDIAHFRCGPHLLGHGGSEPPDLGAIGTSDAHLHRPANRRTIE